MHFGICSPFSCSFNGRRDGKTTFPEKPRKVRKGGGEKQHWGRLLLLQFGNNRKVYSRLKRVRKGANGVDLSVALLRKETEFQLLRGGKILEARRLQGKGWALLFTEAEEAGGWRFSFSPQCQSWEQEERAFCTTLVFRTRGVSDFVFPTSQGSPCPLALREDCKDCERPRPGAGQLCCLREEGERCNRAAGNASFSKRIQKSISQKKVKIELDKSARHLYICDFHKNLIQSVRNRRKRKGSDDDGDSPVQDIDTPEVDLFQLQIIGCHFRTIPVNEKDTLTYFIYSVKNDKNKSDLKMDSSVH
ncbi:Histone deacetylase complex subunit SAP30, partial [Ophiophagus hannah]